MLRFIILYLCTTVLSVVISNEQYKTVKTKSGLVRGLRQYTIWHEKPFYSFRGIPYAKPPVGELRFKATEPVDPWSNIIDAFEYPPRCSQRYKSSRPTSENCLFLNIFVPDLKRTINLAVLLYFHGGFFASGSGDDKGFGPDFMIEHEIILVTMNYRLGMLGFMNLGIPDYSGNMGLKDQQMTLEWIYKNIEAFGGDKNKITIGGSSAGGRSAGFHLINDESSKYFNQMLSISGTPNGIYNYQKGDHRCLAKIFYDKCTSTISNKMWRLFGLEKTKEPPSDEELVDFLKNVDVDKITDFTRQTTNDLFSPWSPIVEKSNAKHPFLLEDPMSKLQKTKINKTAYYTFAEFEYIILIHSNASYSKDIGTIHRNAHVEIPIFGHRTLFRKKRSYLEDVFKRIRKFYFSNALTDEEKLRQRLIMDSDYYFVYFIEKWVEKHVAVSNKKTFYHRFSAHTILNPHNIFEGASHGDETFYLFRCRDYNDLYKYIFNQDNSNTTIASGVMHNLQMLITNFVKNGKPLNNGDPDEYFLPVRRSSEAHQFHCIDVTNDGIVHGLIGPNGNRTKILDNIVEEVKILIEEHGDTITKTPIEQQCDEIIGW
ncbi:esterase B1-like [Contarinia nasturtii]|uniref:esterase B1-like n=1 Tax=Contarinia nasturtii TaxID=265458 RepID=UPI0012D443D2|nr:esterase B1-like [Contarinia nasturtii]